MDYETEIVSSSFTDIILVYPAFEFILMQDKQ